MKGFLSNRGGAVAIEFAAIALPLMLLLGGSIEVSRFIWTRVALQDSASTGARCLGLRLAPCATDGKMDTGGTVHFVQQQASEWAIDISDQSVTPDATSGCENTPDFARIGIRHRLTSILIVLPDTWVEVEACFPVAPPD
ncbi:TadE/TadG family type IV pilus assembly protein [Marivita sp.]|uniref:TadE/TadG family type IV pilus assembly protein n=1 Tax=Marivita sp. TaxID=2003365 RepID=UPI0025C2C6D6|nr:TadE/TadG family type IV pilus assembly protein [Marivita sp.]